MSHAIYGDYNFCIQNALKQDQRQITHPQAWGKRFHSMVQGCLGVVPGNIQHMWHEDAVNRRYFLRMHDTQTLDLIRGQFSKLSRGRFLSGAKVWTSLD